MKIIKSTFFILLILTLSCSKRNIKDGYIKEEVKIEMRDGVNLHTVIYRPDSSGSYPLLLMRTPYSAGPYGNEHRVLPKKFVDAGYIFVFQDVRGRFLSDGHFVNMRPIDKISKVEQEITEATDTYDTVDWLINNVKSNNGNVGVWGISYPGFYASMSLMSGHPAIKAVSPQAPISDWFIGDDMHHYGAFSYLLATQFFSGFGIPHYGNTISWPERKFKVEGSAYKYYLNAGSIQHFTDMFNNEIPFWICLINHTNYNRFWQIRNTLIHFENIEPAVLTVGGWFDFENAYGSLNTYKAIEYKNIPNNGRLVMGPWSHGAWSRSKGDKLGDISFGSNTSEFFQDSIEFPFFEYYLKNKGEFNFPEAIVFETGTNVWKKYDRWPPKGIERYILYFGKDNELTTNRPNFIHKYEWESDPKNPVPYSKKALEESNSLYEKSFMTEDQSFTMNRGDVLTFSTKPLEEDITFSGELFSEIYFTSTGTDLDIVVKLIDGFPDDSEMLSDEEKKFAGYKMLVRGEIFRGKYRFDLAEPLPIVPSKLERIIVPMNDINHTFKKGHKIMVQIQSSWFPLFDMNPQDFVDIYKASPEKFLKQTHSLQISEKYAPRIEFSRLKKKENLDN